RTGTPILGVVLNMVDAEKDSYGRYGKYGRYGRYGKYGKYGRYGAYGNYGDRTQKLDAIREALSAEDDVADGRDTEGTGAGYGEE
ncbi:MAG: hypothetical protein J6U26_04050, partial [Lachnospiraceae bacterium]|nr:hypothetical protein [Lachnospiraceae bacterium]